MNKLNWKKTTAIWNYCKNFKNNLKKERVDVLHILDVELVFILFEKKFFHKYSNICFDSDSSEDHSHYNFVSP